MFVARFLNFVILWEFPFEGIEFLDVCDENC